MDKLELDARVARLERSLTFLWTLIAIGLASVGVLLFFATVSYEGRVATPSPMIMAPASPVAAIVENPGGGRTLEGVERELLALKELQERHLISGEERAAKVDRMLGEFRVLDMKADLEKIKELEGKKLLDDSERDLARKRVLRISP